MAFTYDPDDLDEPINQLRLLIQDTNEDEPILQDNEILFVHAGRNNFFRSAARLCRVIALKFAKEASITDGEVKISAETAAREYRLLAKDLDTQALEFDNSLESGSGGDDEIDINIPNLPTGCSTFRRDTHLS